MNEQIDLLAYEQKYWAEHCTYIAGIDEVGRGCLFGDVVAAAVILPKGLLLPGVNDSKKLSVSKRESLYENIMQQAVAVAVGAVSAQRIDELNIKQASRLAMKRAVEALSITPHMLLVDAEQIDLSLPQCSIIKGDARSQSIAAASIVAKVTRDRLCQHEWESCYPQYGIATHKGYATKLHRDRIRHFGPSSMHRRTFLANVLTNA